MSVKSVLCSNIMISASNFKQVNVFFFVYFRSLSVVADVQVFPNLLIQDKVFVPVGHSLFADQFDLDE